MIRSDDVPAILSKRFVPEALLVLLSFLAAYPHLLSYFTSDDFLLLEKAGGFSWSAVFSPYLDIPIGIFYRPAASLFYAGVFQIAGYQPPVYHLVSFSLHALNCVLFYRLLIMLPDRFRFTLFAFPAAAVVAVHPRTQETVATIYCFPDLLAVALSLLTVILVAMYLVSKDRWSLGCALLTFFTAVVTKESAYILLPIVFLLGIALIGGRPFKLQPLQFVIPALLFIVVFLAALGLRYAAVGSFLLNSEYANYAVGHTVTFILKGFTAFVLSASIISILSKNGAIAVMGILTLVLVVLLVRNARSTEIKLVVFLVVVSAALLLPSSMFAFSLRAGQENRFLYFSLFPLSAASILVLSLLVPSRQVVWLKSVVLVACLLVLTYVESGTWRTAALYSRSMLESYSALCSDEDDRETVLLDGLMYLDGAAVGITPSALRLAQTISGHRERIHNPQVLTFLSLEGSSPDAAVSWIQKGDTLIGRSVSGKPVFLGPVTNVGERLYFRSTNGATIEARDYDSQLNSARLAVVYPLSSFRRNTMFMTTTGRALKSIDITPGKKE